MYCRRYIIIFNITIYFCPFLTSYTTSTNTFFSLNVDKNWHFMDHLSCPRSFYKIFTKNETFFFSFDYNNLKKRDGTDHGVSCGADVSLFRKCNGNRD